MIFCILHFTNVPKVPRGRGTHVCGTLYSTIIIIDVSV